MKKVVIICMILEFCHRISIVLHQALCFFYLMKNINNKYVVILELCDLLLLFYEFCNLNRKQFFFIFGLISFAKSLVWGGGSFLFIIKWNIFLRKCSWMKYTNGWKGYRLDFETGETLWHAIRKTRKMKVIGWNILHGWHLRMKYCGVTD
jgi:hypothetical protein